ncbi:retina development in camera-type eye [Mactra antiquata]
MFSLKSLWKPWSGDNQKPPEKDERITIADTLMSELDYHIKEAEQLKRDHEQELRRKETGVDYSWLVCAPVKCYEIPQFERLELEEMCYQVKPSECSTVIGQFRDALLNEPKANEMPRILKACIRQVIDHRPKDESITEWVVKRTVSLTNMKIRPPSKVQPCDSVEKDDLESQSTIDTVCSRVEVISPPFLTDRSYSFPRDGKAHTIESLPV